MPRPRPAAPAAAARERGGRRQEKLKAAVMNEPAVQTLLDVFPADINDVEEM